MNFRLNGWIAAIFLFVAPVQLAAEEASPTPGLSPHDSAPPAPDYNLDSSWAARPGREGAATTVAPGASPRNPGPEVDVFYVHPTTDRSKTYWNQDVANSAVNTWTDESVIARQAGAFNGCCRIIAPRYRQATLAGFDRADLRKEAFSIAYSDVLRAFDVYIKRWNAGRPFIIVGHSQGAAHVAKLLEDRIDQTPLRHRMVAAYVIGINVVEGDFGRTYKNIKFCTEPLQTGCELAWDSFLPNGDGKSLIDASAKDYVARYGDVPGKELVCLNPLTFDTSKPAAGVEASKGAAPGRPGFGPLKPLVPHGVSAHCENNGMLIVDPLPSLQLEPLPDGVMHYHDIGLFYEDIRENASRRVQAFLNAHSGSSELHQTRENCRSATSSGPTVLEALKERPLDLRCSTPGQGLNPIDLN